MFSLSDIHVGQPISHERLSVFPLFSSHPRTADYILFETALAAGSAVVEEVTESGSVPQLTVTVTSDKPVLFVEGEELRGAKQNRVINATVLVAAKSQWTLPVSCVEQGRWRYASKTFESAGMHASAKLRSVLKSSVTDTVRMGRGHHSDQTAVWKEVGRQLSCHHTLSQTMAMSDNYDQQREKLNHYQNQIPYVEGAVGLAAAIGGIVVSLDVFDAPETCRKVWPRILTGLVFDAEEAKSTEMQPDVISALEMFQIGAWESVPAVGIGEEYRVSASDRSFHGSALFLNNHLVHGSMIFSSVPEAMGV